MVARAAPVCDPTWTETSARYILARWVAVRAFAFAAAVDPQIAGAYVGVAGAPFPAAAAAARGFVASAAAARRARRG